MPLLIKKNTSIHYYGDGAILNENIFVSNKVVNVLNSIIDGSGPCDEQIVDKLILYGFVTKDLLEAGNYYISGIPGSRCFESITFELTSSCTLFCKYCYKSASPKNSTYLSFEMLRSIVDRLNGTNKIQLTGGEPTCHPDLPRIVDYLHSQRKRIAIITNGT